MMSIVTVVLEATVGFLVSKGRDAAAAKLREGDVTDERFRNMIVRDLDDIKSKLGGLSRKDLLSSIGFFKEGVLYLYQALNNKSNGDEDTVQTQAAAESEKAKSQRSLQSVTADKQIVSLVSGQIGRKNLTLSDLNDSGRRALSKAKKRFDDARMKATEAFNNAALSTPDRILAMQYRVMSTILEEIDNPKEALPVCRLCLEELHSMPAVVTSFQVDRTGGLRSWFKKQERDEIIRSVRDVNRVIGRVTAVVDGVLSSQFEDWPSIKIGESYRVEPTNFPKLVAPWSFGKEGEGQLERPQSITTTTHGDYIVADKDVIKVFSQGGEFLYSFIPEPGLVIEDVVTDHSDNLYVLFKSKICVFDNPVKSNNKKSSVINLEGAVQGKSVTVNGEQKVFVLVKCLREKRYIVRVYEADGQFVTSFGNYDFECRLNGPFCTGDGSVVINEYRYWPSKSHIQEFDAQGKELVRRVLSGRRFGEPIVKAVHPTTNYLIAVTESLTISIYNKGELPVRYVEIDTDDKVCSVTGVTVTKEGRIAVLCQIKEINSQDFKGVVYVV